MAAQQGLRRLLTNAGSLAVGGVLAQLVFVAIEASIARHLGRDAYGTFTAVYTLTLLMVLALDMGMNWKLIQDGSREPRSIAANLYPMLTLKLVFFLAAYPIIVSVLIFASVDVAVYRLFAVFAFFGLLMTLQDSLAAVSTALERNWINALFQTAMPLAILASMVLLALPAPDMAGVGIAYIVGGVATTSVWLYLTARQFPASAAARRISIARSKEILAGSYHYGLTALIAYGGFKSGIVLLAILRPAAEVALFAAAFKLLELGLKVPTMAVRVVAPKLYADWVHRPVAFVASADALMRLSGAVSAAFAVVLFVAGAPIVKLIFGPEFTTAGPLTRLLAVSLAFKTFSLMSQTILTAGQQLEFRTRAASTAALIGTLAGALMILQWGVIGAALGMLVGDVVMLLLVLGRVRHVVPQVPTVFLAGAPCVAVALSLTITSALPWGSAYSLILALLLLAVLLILFGYLKPIAQLLATSFRQ